MSCSRRIDTATLGRNSHSEAAMLIGPQALPGKIAVSNSHATISMMSENNVQYQYSDRDARPDEFA